MRCFYPGCELEVLRVWWCGGRGEHGFECWFGWVCVLVCGCDGHGVRWEL